MHQQFIWHNTSLVPEAEIVYGSHAKHQAQIVSWCLKTVLEQAIHSPAPFSGTKAATPPPPQQPHSRLGVQPVHNSALDSFLPPTPAKFGRKRHTHPGQSSVALTLTTLYVKIMNARAPDVQTHSDVRTYCIMRMSHNSNHVAAGQPPAMHPRLHD